LKVIAPSADFFDVVTDEHERARCTVYLERAVSVHTMPVPHAAPAAYLTASELLVDRCDRLLAVWDGEDSSGTRTEDTVVISGHGGEHGFLVPDESPSRPRLRLHLVLSLGQ
jgi:hypothetical protein